MWHEAGVPFRALLVSSERRASERARCCESSGSRDCMWGGQAVGTALYQSALHRPPQNLLPAV
jgi:hypothetical protein